LEINNVVKGGEQTDRIVVEIMTYRKFYCKIQGGIIMKLLLELKYKQGDQYHIVLDNKEYSVIESNLAFLIDGIPSERRNCRIVNGEITMKTGYGSLVVRSESSEPKDYVQVYLNDENIKGYKYIKDAPAKFRDIPFKEFEPYFDILSLEHIQIIDKNKGIVQNEFGNTTKDNLSSGMQSMLVALKYSNEKKGYTVNVSNCSGDYLRELCRRIRNKDIKIVILHGDILDIDTNLKFNRTIYENGLELFQHLCV
jgi:hypothetical protein